MWVPSRRGHKSNNPQVCFLRAWRRVSHHGVRVSSWRRATTRACVSCARGDAFFIMVCGSSLGRPTTPTPRMRVSLARVDALIITACGSPLGEAVGHTARMRVSLARGDAFFIMVCGFALGAAVNQTARMRVSLARVDAFIITVTESPLGEAIAASHRHTRRTDSARGLHARTQRTRAPCRRTRIRA